MANNLVKSSRTAAPWRDFFNVDNFFDNGWLSKWEKDFPAVNISENEKNYSVEVVAPGFKKEDFKVKENAYNRAKENLKGNGVKPLE